MFNVLTSHSNFSLEWKNGQVYVDGMPHQIEFKKIHEGEFEINWNGSSFEADLLEVNPEEKIYIFRISNQKVKIKLREPLDDLLDKMGMNQGLQHTHNIIKAPMPGMVLHVLAKVGSTIQKGDPLVILEAMKMENILKSPSNGIVEEILVSEKDKVEKNTILIKLS